MLIVFGRRAQSAAITQIEGKPGAAAAALGMLRRGWKTEPAIAFTKQQDVVTASSARPASCWSARATPTGCGRC